MLPATLEDDDMQELISETKEALARLGKDLARFDHLVEREELPRFGRDLALFNQLLALLSEHMTVMHERINGAQRAGNKVTR